MQVQMNRCKLRETIAALLPRLKRGFYLNSETFAAGAMGDCVRVGNSEAAFLQIFAVIEYRTAHEKCAFWIDNQSDIRRWHENVALFGAIHEIPLILQAGAAAGHHRETSGA